MPLKKKGKGKAKGKAKGKGKGKGKKGSKEPKVDKDDVMREALSNARMWEVKFGAADKSRQEYRNNTRTLITQNEKLQGVVEQTERDTIEVIAYLKKEDAAKESEIERLKELVREVKAEAHKEKEQLEESYSQHVAQLQASLSEKDDEVKVIQGELKIVREFRKKRGEMQQKLDRLKETLEESARDHDKAMATMEYKFFEEKLRLQKEANRRIADLAGKAHDEAVANIDERTREVYRENLDMANALTLHMENEAALQKSTGQLEMSNRQLVAEKELNQQLVKEKIAQARKQKKLIKELQEKVESLEQSLTMLVREFEEEKRVMEADHASQLQDSRTELVALQRRHDLQDREMAHVKRLARKILDERSEMETFFMDALTHVRSEIAANREQYRSDAQALYQQQLLEATRGQGGFPPVRTFKPGQKASTNSVYQEMDQAHSWGRVQEGDKVDISELTWEQKEQVLRLLFFKMNQATPTSRRKSKQTTPSLPSVSVHSPSHTHKPTPPHEPHPHDLVFITQGLGGGAEATASGHRILLAKAA